MRRWFKLMVAAAAIVVCLGSFVAGVALAQPIQDAFTQRLEEFQQAHGWRRQIGETPTQSIMDDITAMAEVMRPAFEDVFDPGLTERQRRVRIMTPAISLWRANATIEELADTITLLTLLEPWLSAE